MSAKGGLVVCRNEGQAIVLRAGPEVVRVRVYDCRENSVRVRIFTPDDPDGTVWSCEEAQTIGFMMCGEHVKLQVFDTIQGKVRLRVTAPRSVQVNREEIDREKFADE